VQKEGKEAANELEDFAIRLDLNDVKHAEKEKHLMEKKDAFPDEVYATFTIANKKHAVRFVKIERGQETSPASSLDVYKLDAKVNRVGSIVKHAVQNEQVCNRLTFDLIRLAKQNTLINSILIFI
jgi:hypothetical protein